MEAVCKTPESECPQPASTTRARLGGVGLNCVANLGSSGCFVPNQSHPPSVMLLANRGRLDEWKQVAGGKVLPLSAAAFLKGARFVQQRI